MTDILPPITDDKRLRAAGFGKGSVVLITDECVAALVPCRYNGNDTPAITLQTLGSDNCRGILDVRPGMPKAEVDDLLEAFQDEMSEMQPLTCTHASGSEADQWRTAAKILRALADAAEARAQKEG